MKNSDNYKISRWYRLPRKQLSPTTIGRWLAQSSRSVVLGTLLVLLALPVFGPALDAQERYVGVAEGEGGAVATGHPEATATALRILQEGGNAVDAAVAASFALGVVDFSNSGLGGDGFALLRHSDGRLIAFSAAAPPPFLSGVATAPHGFPAELALLTVMHRTFGCIPRSRLVSDAIRLAEQGFPATEYLADITTNLFDSITDHDARTFLSNSGKPFKAGDIIKQPALADTLRRIGEDGGASFYRGTDAATMLEHLNSLGSPFTLDDFAAFQPQRRLPVELQCGPWRLVGCPPPSSSVVVLALIEQLLSLLPEVDTQSPDPKVITLLDSILSLKHYHLGDCVRNPRKFLHLAREPRFLRKYTTKPDTTVHNNAESSHTTHLVVWDKNDMIVSMTLTLGNHFGSRVLSPLGFFYNNQMRNFSSTISVYNSDYPVWHGPISAKAPIFLLKDNHPVVALGGAGANRIIVNIALIAASLVKGQRNLAAAVAQPRFYPTYSGTICWEDHPALSSATNLSGNSKKGKLPYGSDYFGLITAIQKEDNVLRAVSDFRRDAHAGALP